MRLTTLVHISDIHISDANFDAAASTLYAVVPMLDGFLGHSYKSLTMLEPFFADLSQKEKAQLILTGDLTRVGGAWEFETASEFLQNELVPPKGFYVGLRNANWRKLAIPGNHDRYPGFPCLVGGPTPPFSALFPIMPLVVDVPLASSTGHLLRFLLIDTDADVWAWGTNRAKAKGSFVSQLRSLSALPAPEEREIRILCLHHSRAHRGFTLEMDRKSRNQLDDFILAKGIAVLLSGHIHDPPQVVLAKAAGARGTATYLEARCGTTTQQNLFHLPYYWRKLPGFRNKSHWANTLFVHRIFEEAGEIVWESELYLEHPSNGFQLATPQQSGSVVTSRVRVWPQPVK